MTQKKHPGMKVAEPNQQQMDAIKEQIVAKQFDGKFMQALGETEYPGEGLTDEWIKAAATSMEHESPLSLGISGPSMAELYHKIHENVGIPVLNLFDVATLNNAIEKRTARELDTCMGGYLKVLEDSAAVSTTWNEIAAPMRAEIAESIRQSINLKQAEDELGKPTGRFGAIRAEA